MYIQIKQIFLLAFIILVSCTPSEETDLTEITKWPDNKTGAVTLTYDDSTINHFRVAIPLMNELELPGTFYLITGSIPGSEYEGEFVGRDVEEIIAETADESTNEENFFERASAIRYLGYRDVHQYHREAGSNFERGNIEEAYAAIDEGYERVRNGEFDEGEAIEQYLYDVLFVEPGTELITWEELQEAHRDGFHEFGSHTVTHPYLAVMDEANILYELEKSREDLERYLGEDHIFSVEGPFGTEDERVMPYLFETYPAARNRMPEPFLEELNRGSGDNPAAFDAEYVQWQRGPLEETPMDLMKSWVDTVAENDNIWLVLVFHGVEGVGWEPKPEEELEEYFRYIKEHEDDLWIATFKDATKYIRQRMNTTVESSREDGRILVSLTHSLGELYDLPLTLKTALPPDWGSVSVTQSGEEIDSEIYTTGDDTYVLYQAVPNREQVEIVFL
ncbi:MAG: polysaccharide deacetylase family protein [Balneolaceae bacterium]